MKKKFTNVKFNKKLYSHNSVAKARELFKDVAEFTVKINSKYFQVNINADDNLGDMLADEFCNAVLMFTRKK